MPFLTAIFFWIDYQILLFLFEQVSETSKSILQACADVSWQVTIPAMFSIHLGPNYTETLSFVVGRKGVRSVLEGELSFLFCPLSCLYTWPSSYEKQALSLSLNF